MFQYLYEFQKKDIKILYVIIYIVWAMQTSPVPLRIPLPVTCI